MSKWLYYTVKVDSVVVFGVGILDVHNVLQKVDVDNGGLTIGLSGQVGIAIGAICRQGCDVGVML